MKRLLFLLLMSFIVRDAYAQNNALHFDGIDDYVDIPAPNSLLSGNAFTIECWYKPVGISSHPQTLVARKSGTMAWVIGSFSGSWNNTDNLFFYLNTGSTEIFLPYSYDFSILGQWHHVAVVYNGSAIKLYSDGVLVGQDAYSGNMGMVSGNIRLGNAPAPVSSGSTALSGAYNGMIDELRIWSISRTQAEIQAAKDQEMQAATVGLSTLYHFNQGNANGNNAGVNTLSDATVTALHGSLANFALTGTTSNWTSGFPLVALPLKLISFTVRALPASMLLQWRTVMEDHFQAFEIERSLDGRRFARIGAVPAGGNPAGASYTFNDRNKDGSKTWYRLKMVDQDGRYEYSKIIIINPGSKNSFSLYPNPVQSTLHIGIHVSEPGPVSIVNSLGQVVMTIVGQGRGAYFLVDVSGLQKGVYYLKVGEYMSPFLKL